MNVYRCYTRVAERVCEGHFERGSESGSQRVWLDQQQSTCERGVQHIARQLISCRTAS